MINIAIIKPNKFVFDKHVYENGSVKLMEMLNEYVQILCIENDKLMDVMVTALDMKPESLADGIVCYENAHEIYQLFMITDSNNIGKDVCRDDEKKNMIGTHLCNKDVGGNCVMICEKVRENDVCNNGDVSIDNVSQILWSKFVHKGIFIGVNSVSEFVYFHHPLEYYKCDEYDENKYKILDFDFLSLSLCAVLINGAIEVNKMMTRIVGNDCIKGDVLLIHKDIDAYLDLDLVLFGKINKLAYGSLDLRELKDIDKEEKKIGELCVVNNKYCVIERRLRDVANNLKCGNDGCKKVGKCGNVCSSCYRVKYHDIECQERDFVMHKNMCVKK